VFLGQVGALLVVVTHRQRMRMSRFPCGTQTGAGPATCPNTWSCELGRPSKFRPRPSSLVSSAVSMSGGAETEPRHIHLSAGVRPAAAHSTHW